MQINRKLNTESNTTPTMINIQVILTRLQQEEHKQEQERQERKRIS